MTFEQLEEQLNYVDSTRESRLKTAAFFESHPEYIPWLVETIFKKVDALCIKASWILEYLCITDLGYIIPYLDLFTENIYSIKSESACRPIAKICEQLVSSHYLVSNKGLKLELSPKHQKAISSFCFDMLINDHKVATKVFSMSTLELLGKDHDWIHNELIHILERQYPNQSNGFRSRAKKIMQRLKRNT